MKLQIICQRCQARFHLEEAKLQGKPVQFHCRKCQQIIVIKPTPMGVDLEGGFIQSLFRTVLPTEFADLKEVQRLASGGMGEIYLAKMSGAEGFERQVALKVLHPHLCRDDSFVQVMVEEAKLSVLLNHPNIVHVYNLRKYDDLLYLVMEYLPGKSLGNINTTYLQKGSLLPVEMAVFILCEVLEGLAYAHALKGPQGQSLSIVHRDVSPHNILVTRDGWVKLIDFGIAKAATRVGETLPGVIKGKVAYMAPEQFEGQVDHRADLFSAAATLWEALAGFPLFAGPNAMATMHKLLFVEPLSLLQIRPEIPRKLDGVLLKALEKKPDRRFQSAREMKASLLEAMAPWSLEQMREKVDIDAAAITDRPAIQLQSITLSLDQDPAIQPVPAAARPGLAALGRKQKPLLLAALALSALLGAAVLILLARSGPAPTIPPPSAQPPPAAAAPRVVPPDAPAAPAPLNRESASLAPALDGPAVAVAGPDAPTAPNAPNAARVNPAPRKQPVAVAARKTASPPPQPPAPLDRPGIEAVLHQHDPEMTPCVSLHLAGQRAQEIRVQVSLGIDAEGAVQRAELRPRFIATSPFGQCLEAAIRKIRFPRHPAARSEAVVPLTFKVGAP